MRMVVKVGEARRCDIRLVIVAIQWNLNTRRRITMTATVVTCRRRSGSCTTRNKYGHVRRNGARIVGHESEMKNKVNDNNGNIMPR